MHTTVKLICTINHTCDGHDDYWKIQLNSGGGKDSWLLYTNNDTNAVGMRMNHPEFSMKLAKSTGNQAINCSVNSSLEITLLEDSVRSTSEHLIISCGVQCGVDFRLPAAVSAVVYLPLSSPTTEPTACPTVSAADCLRLMATSQASTDACGQLGTWPGLVFMVGLLIVYTYV